MVVFTQRCLKWPRFNPSHFPEANLAMTVEQNIQRQNSFDKLTELVRNKLELKRPVFFIPGWTDEACVCWKTPYLKGGTCIKEWTPKVIKNSELVNYISFSVAS